MSARSAAESTFGLAHRGRSPGAHCRVVRGDKTHHGLRVIAAWSGQSLRGGMLVRILRDLSPSSGTEWLSDGDSSVVADLAAQPAAAVLRATGRGSCCHVRQLRCRYINGGARGLTSTSCGRSRPLVGTHVEVARTIYTGDARRAPETGPSCLLLSWHREYRQDQNPSQSSTMLLPACRMDR